MNRNLKKNSIRDNKTSGKKTVLMRNSSFPICLLCHNDGLCENLASLTWFGSENIKVILETSPDIIQKQKS